MVLHTTVQGPWSRDGTPRPDVQSHDPPDADGPSVVVRTGGGTGRTTVPVGVVSSERDRFGFEGDTTVDGHTERVRVRDRSDTKGWDAFVYFESDLDRTSKERLGDTWVGLGVEESPPVSHELRPFLGSGE